MAYRETRHIPTDNESKQPTQSHSPIAIATLATPAPDPPLSKDYKRQSSWSSDHAVRSTDLKSVMLPSIRQAIPELHLNTLSTGSYGKSQRPPKIATSGSFSPKSIPSPGTGLFRHLQISTQGGPKKMCTNGVLRSSCSPDRLKARQLTPPFGLNSAGTDKWSRLPPLQVYKPPVSKPRSAPASYRSFSSDLVNSPAYGTSHNDYPYNGQNSRYQLQSEGSVPYDERLQLKASTHSSPHGASQCASQYREMDVMEMSDARQRKRRVKLAKETTDKLHAWLAAHIQHPYPTEDEKQGLMRQTGLEKNQISNWFINARRRQLPAIVRGSRVKMASIKRKSIALGERSDAGDIER